MLVASAAAAAEADYVDIPRGTLASALANDADNAPVVVDAFRMRVTPVSKGEFQRFVANRPQWQRGKIARTFADATYLQDWKTSLALAGPDEPDRPAVNVSWFAAQEFCESEGGRLPTWYEWEYVAAADATRRDARADPAWLARILGWYATSTHAGLPAVGGAANVYGARDMHGLVWEWVDDFNALLVSPDSRSGDDQAVSSRAVPLGSPGGPQRPPGLVAAQEPRHPSKRQSWRTVIVSPSRVRATLAPRAVVENRGLSARATVAPALPVSRATTRPSPTRAVAGKERQRSYWLRLPPTLRANTVGCPALRNASSAASW